MQEEEHATVPAQKQRIAALATGGVLALGGVRRRGILGISSVILGGNLVYEGLKGNSPLFRALGINHGVRGAAAVVPHGQSKRTEATVTIARPEDELFAWWRQLDHLPAIMDHIQSVHVVDERTSHWEMSLPAGKLEWDAEVYNEIRDELIAWRALPNSPINHAGTVRFGEAPGGRGTIVNLSISYAPPLGKLGAAAAALLPQEPARAAYDALRKFKQLMEAGELTTSRMRHDAMASDLDPISEPGVATTAGRTDR